jgi:hypothetical protein
MDPIAVSFVVFFSLFMGGFLFLICLGCLIHCCCTMDVPRYRGEVTDEAIVCERLTRKERLAVIEKVFSNYDSLVRNTTWKYATFLVMIATRTHSIYITL